MHFRMQFAVFRMQFAHFRMQFEHFRMQFAVFKMQFALFRMQFADLGGRKPPFFYTFTPKIPFLPENPLFFSKVSPGTAFQYFKLHLAL